LEIKVEDPPKVVATWRLSLGIVILINGGGNRNIFVVKCIQFW